MSLLGAAAVTIWHNVPPEMRADYYEWHHREHMPERLGIPGFLRGRRYIALTGDPEFCTVYETESLDVLTGADYTQRLNNPTPWTRRVASRLHGNVRSLCRVALSLGPGQGGLMMSWRYDVEPGHEAAHRALIEARLRLLAERPQIVGAHLCLGDAAASAVQTSACTPLASSAMPIQPRTAPAHSTSRLSCWRATLASARCARTGTRPSNASR